MTDEEFKQVLKTLSEIRERLCENNPVKAFMLVEYLEAYIGGVK